MAYALRRYGVTDSGKGFIQPASTLESRIQVQDTTLVSGVLILLRCLESKTDHQH
jgi:hypothetical protein